MLFRSAGWQFLKVIAAQGQQRRRERARSWSGARRVVQDRDLAKGIAGIKHVEAILGAVDFFERPDATADNEVEIVRGIALAEQLAARLDRLLDEEFRRLREQRAGHQYAQR